MTALTDADKAQMTNIIRRVTKGRNAPAATDDDTELLLRLLAERDDGIAALIEFEAESEIEGEKP